MSLSGMDSLDENWRLLLRWRACCLREPDRLWLHSGLAARTDPRATCPG
jgi:hypothetical protein